jgi:hypothetical protein
MRPTIKGGGMALRQRLHAAQSRQVEWGKAVRSRQPCVVATLQQQGCHMHVPLEDRHVQRRGAVIRSNRLCCNRPCLFRHAVLGCGAALQQLFHNARVPAVRGAMQQPPHKQGSTGVRGACAGSLGRL